jgi:uroporphyrin-III C-methyltransferase/precorrin-2 dehydrogenase/sirohydrochlorin ferrochelatase
VIFPLHVDLRGRRALVVGAGPVGLRRARALAAAGADVQVVALEAPDDLELPVQRRAFTDDDVEGCWLVLACTGTVDADIARACEARRIWCGRSDDASQSSVWVPAVGRTGEVVVSVTAGRDPRRSTAIRDAIVAAIEAGTL